MPSGSLLALKRESGGTYHREGPLRSLNTCMAHLFQGPDNSQTLGPIHQVCSVSIHVPYSRGHYAANHIRPDKMYICVCTCRTREAGAQWISAQPPFGIKSFPLHHVSHSALPTQATSSSVYWQPSQGMNLDGAHQENSTVATLSAADSRQCEWAVVIYFLVFHLLAYYNFFLVILAISCPSSDNCNYFLKLFIYKNRIKNSAWIHHIVLTVVRNCSVYVFNSLAPHELEFLKQMSNFYFEIPEFKGGGFCRFDINFCTVLSWLHGLIPGTANRHDLGPGSIHGNFTSHVYLNSISGEWRLCLASQIQGLLNVSEIQPQLFLALFW